MHWLDIIRKQRKSEVWLSQSCYVGLAGMFWKSPRATVFTLVGRNDHTNGLLIVCCVCMVSKTDFTSRLCLWLRFSSSKLSRDCREDGDSENALFMFKAPWHSRHWIQYDSYNSSTCWHPHSHNIGLFLTTLTSVHIQSNEMSIFRLCYLTNLKL